MRIGVNTGEVVVRTIQTGAHPEYTPVGHVTQFGGALTDGCAGRVGCGQ